MFSTYTSGVVEYIGFIVKCYLVQSDNIFPKLKQKCHLQLLLLLSLFCWDYCAYCDDKNNSLQAVSLHTVNSF